MVIVWLLCGASGKMKCKNVNVRGKIEMGEGKKGNGRGKMKKTIKQQNINNEIIKY
jgi:hypothetical protein